MSFNQLVAENNNDPQWVVMIQSLINYKGKLIELEEKQNTKHTISFKQTKHNIRKHLLTEYKIHTIQGKQFIRTSHLTAVLNQSKILKRDCERDGFVSLNALVDWIHEENEKVKKTWLKKYGC